MSRKKRLFVLLISAILCFAMAVPVSAGTTYRQRKKASQKLFNAIYYGKYSKSYNLGSDCYVYDMDINKDGYPEHVITNLDEDMCIIYTIYKSKIRRYVFKNASVSRYKKQFLITTNYDNDDSGIQILESKFYNVVKGKLVSNPKQKLTDVNDWLNGYESKYLKAGKEISIDAYYKIFNKQKRLKSSSYWSKLFNATKNFS